MNKFDPTKPCQFRNPSIGKVLRLLANDIPGEYPLCFLVEWANKKIDTYMTSADGRNIVVQLGMDDYDIINVPEKREPIEKWEVLNADGIAVYTARHESAADVWIKTYYNSGGNGAFSIVHFREVVK